MDFSFLTNLSCDALKILSIFLIFVVSFLVKKVLLERQVYDDIIEKIDIQSKEIKKEVKDTKEIVYSKVEGLLNKIEVKLNDIQKELDELESKINEVNERLLQTSVSLEEGEKIIQNFANEMQRISLIIENYKSEVINELKNELKELGFVMRVKNV